MTNITELRDSTNSSWAEMRGNLWPRLDLVEHQTEMIHLLAKGSSFIAFIARTPEGVPIGFAEATLRVDYVNGCKYSPVAFLEGIYVLPQFRRTGVARDLLRSVEGWGESKGCIELASDADINNTDAHQVHRKLGFLETQRVIYFKKNITMRDS